jgi:hypothetical protein
MNVLRGLGEPVGKGWSLDASLTLGVAVKLARINVNLAASRLRKKLLNQ